jgi:class 3 adenylate cyclase
VNIAYQVVGAGPIDLVVAPGYMSHLEQNWRWPDNARFIERLASFARVILFDRRGTGLSDRLVATSGFDEVMDDIAAVMDAAESTRAALLGGAEGGPMCILFAAAFPKRTQALILVASYARGMWAPDYPWGLGEAAHRRILATYEERWGREPVGAHLVAPTLANVPGFAAWYTAAQRHGGSPGAALAWYRITTEIDVRHVLPAVRVPTLVVHRTGDRVQPIESGRCLAEQIPGARYVELPGDDHFWFAGDADRILDEIEEFLTGTRHGPEPDRVLATVLFTDLVDSTERGAALGDPAWRDLLTQHHALVRAELARWRGREVDTAGDGFLATFDGPGRAIGCAVAIRNAARAIGIEIRAGLHTGECELLGDRVTGIALDMGARVAALASAGEVLVSSTVKDLVAGSGISFEERGEQGLKGIPDRWRLYAVVSAAVLKSSDTRGAAGSQGGSVRVGVERDVVGDDALTSCIRELPSALADDAKQPRFPFLTFQ